LDDFHDDDMVCLREFSQEAVNDDGVTVTTEGFVFSSKALLKMIDEIVRSQPAGLSLLADGTYKLLHNGWVMCLLGGHNVKFAIRGKSINSFV